MRRINRFVLALTALLLAALACNLPQATPATSESNAAFTAAAQTVAAQLSQSAPLPVSPTMPANIPTISIPPTNTFLPPTIAPPPTIPPTATQECDKAQFIADVNIPDGTVKAPGEAFIKTWRIKNIGACSWTGYSLVFDDGNPMGGPASSAIGNTPPGGTLDISINLVAPATTGNYRGYWRIRNSSGVLLPVISGYQGKSFYVDIKVSSPSVTVNLPYLPGASGLVANNGTINTLTVAAGDSLGNLGIEAFLSFNMSAIPAGSTIQTASLTLIGGGSVRGDPFGTLGCLRAYVHNYGTVDAGDFVAPGAGGAFAKWCSAGETGSALSNATLVAAIQGAVGLSQFQFRLQFKDTLTNGNGTIDDVLIIAPVTLTITYTAP
jgi:hypothetical protein